MLATYGVDVHDPTVSLRRIHVLRTRLPAGSLPALDNAAAWSTETHLLADLLDAVNGLTYVTLRAHGAKPAKPRRIPRPGHGLRPARGPQTPRETSRDTARAIARGESRQVGWGQLGAVLGQQAGMVRRG